MLKHGRRGPAGHDHAMSLGNPAAPSAAQPCGPTACLAGGLLGYYPVTVFTLSACLIQLPHSAW